MKSIKSIVPYLDEIMDLFYRDLLSHKQISIFFSGEEHIRRLIAKQKQNFIESLDDSPDEFRKRYLKLGQFHYDIKVPAIDFLRSTQMFRTNFIDYAIRKLNNINLIRKIDKYFRTADVAMCQGYLDRQLSRDKIDLIKLIEYYENPELKTSHIGISHLKWLLNILEAIENKRIGDITDLEINDCKAHHFLADEDYLSDIPFTTDHLSDLHERIHIDAQNLFYFIENEDYPEVLSLYSSLLSAYKITLIFMGNHALHLDLVQSNKRLKETTKNLKDLEEIVPICSYCNHIRDDEGAWGRLEAYFQAKHGSKFSHGICPSCYKKIGVTKR